MVARPRTSERPRRTGRFALLLAVVLASCIVALMLGGCIVPDRIMQKIYEDDERYPVDDSVPATLVNDPFAEKTSELLPKISEDEESDFEDETVEKDPEFSEEDVNSSESVASPLASDANSDLAGVNQAGGQPSRNESTGTSDSNAGEDADPGSGDDPSDTREDDKKDDDGDKQDDNSARDVVREADDYVVDVGDEAQEIPDDVTRIAAVGDAATVVAMLGGDEQGSPLVAADRAFVDANKVLLQNRGVSENSVAAVWNDDGSVEADLNDEGFDALLNTVKPDMVLYSTADDPLSDDQIVKLKDAGVRVWALDFTRREGIAAAVATIGETLAQGGNPYAESRAAEYESFCNSILDTIGDASSGSRKYTLYISDWDAGARFANADFDSSHGVGIAQLGSQASPLVYYLGKAGVTNTAATGPKFENATANRASVVWQFKANYAACKYAGFSSLDTSKATFDLTGGSGFDNALLYSNDGGAFTDAFPGLIVATRQIRDDYLLPDMMLKNGLYHPYGSVDAGTLGTVVGFKPASTTYESAIGFVSGKSTSTLYDKAGVLSANYVDHVYVNPHGLYSSWVDGSVESVLETAWAYAAVRLGGGKDTDLGLNVGGSSTAADIVERFYETFYGYEIGAEDLAAVFGGLE